MFTSLSPGSHPTDSLKDVSFFVLIRKKKTHYYNEMGELLLLPVIGHNVIIPITL